MKEDTEQMIADAKSVVLRFAAAYTEWEQAMAVAWTEIEQAMEKDPDFDITAQDPAFQQARADIVKTYCTPKKRVYVDESITFSMPPTYSHVVEANIFNTVLVSDTRAHIDAKGLQTIHRFVVLRKKDGWQLDSIKWKVSENEEWQNGLIGSP